MVVLSVILAAIALLLCYCCWFQTYSRTAKLLNAFPSPGVFMPVLGGVWQFSRKRDIIFQQLQELLGKFNETISIWGGPNPCLLIKTADDAEIILSNVKHINKGELYRVFDSWLNKGLLTSTGKKWHQRRKMLTPAFHYNILQMFVEVFGEQCENLKNILTEESYKTKTDIMPIIKLATLSTICETSMGVKLDQNNKYLGRYYNAVHKIGEVFIERIFKPWLHIDMLYSIFPLSWRERKLVKYLHKFSSDIIESKEKTFREEDVTDLEVADTKSKKRLAMLDLLFYAKRHLGEIDDEGIREEVDTFVFEGHDTTAVGISFALLLIANYRDIQEKIIAELDEIFGDSDRHATYDDLQNMKYLECCLKESLRLYPSVPFITRKLTEDTTLTHHVAPAGTEIVLFIYNVHRDPTYYPDPEKFDPDRFLPENSKGRHPYAYIPFSAGPRNCIGQKFAMLELKSIVSSILRNFTLEPIDTPQDLSLIVDVVLRAKESIHMKFRARNNK